LILQFVVALVSFAVLDTIWLGFVMKDFNLRALSEIGRIEDGKFQLAYFPAAVVYVLMALAVVIFVLPRVQEPSPWWFVFGIGALMGLVVYGVFDMTNLAILKNYPWSFALADIAWGTFAFGAVTLISNKIAG
jgi:uncharacterized membrane protein